LAWPFVSVTSHLHILLGIAIESVSIHPKQSPVQKAIERLASDNIDPKLFGLIQIRSDIAPG